MKQLSATGVLSIVLLACMTMSAMSSPSSAQCNLLTNPGFEDSGGSFNGWFTFEMAFVSTPSTDNIFRTGSAAGKAFGSFTGDFNVSGFGQAFVPTEGMVYQLDGYSYVSSNDPIFGTTCEYNRMIAKIVFFDDAVGGSEISANEVLIGDGSTPTDQWHFFSVSAPVPPGAMRVEALFLFLQPGLEPGAVFVDDVSFCEVPPPLPEPDLLVNGSFDTDLSGWTTFGNVYHESRAFALRTVPGSAKLFGTFVPDANSGMSQSFAATSGSSWKLDLYSMQTCVGDPPERINGFNLAVAKIVFRDAGYNEIGSDEVLIGDGSSPLGTWTRHSVIAMAPPGTNAVEAFILFIQPDPTEGGSVLVDDVRFAQYPIVPTFIQAFDAETVGSDIVLRWDIVTDGLVKGFKILRRNAEEKVADVVNGTGLIAPDERQFVDYGVQAGTTYEYTLVVVMGDGSEVASQLVSVRSDEYPLVLHQNHPNPFNPSTRISFMLPKRTVTGLSIYNIEGELVTTLVDETLDAGLKEVTWNGKDAHGNQVSTGVYFYHLTAGNRTLTKKMVLLK